MALPVVPKKREGPLTEDEYDEFLKKLDVLDKDHQGISDKAFVEEVFTKYAQKPTEEAKEKTENGDDDDDSSIMDKLVGSDQPSLTK